MRPLSVCYPALLLLLAPFAAAADECRPVTWEDSNLRLADGMATATAPSRPIATPSVPYNPEPDTGEVNCRSWDQTYDKANYYSCKKMADFNSISIEEFFILNPEIDEDCSNVRPYTRYCVNGFLEPLRAYDGKCGPKNKDATCMSSGHGDCCNSQTWTCGSNPESDCGIGICYEGDCWGHKIYTTDGFCGVEHGMRKCGGKWGDCCNMQGRCGTGKDFCSDANCMMGECDRNKVTTKITSSATATTTSAPKTSTTSAATTTTTTTSTGTTTPGAAWVAQGCYKDNAPASIRPLPDRLINNSGSLTIQTCQTACRNGGYTMAGVENGNQCFCGTDVQEPAKNTPALETDCNKPCTGNNGQTCGGTGRMFLYRFAVPKQPVWSPLGCHKDLAPTTPRPLPDRLINNSGSLTVQTCLTVCRNGGYTMAGVENGNHCICGHEVLEPATNTWVSPSECSKPCTGGNGSENCGAAGRMYIYQFAAPERKVWRTVACHKDLFPSAARPLGTLVLRSDTAMTIESCHALCQAGTYWYAGLENGNQCWCDSEIRDVAANTPTALSECSTPCTGNKDQTCGRSARMHIYEQVNA